MERLTLPVSTAAPAARPLPITGSVAGTATAGIVFSALAWFSGVGRSQVHRRAGRIGADHGKIISSLRDIDARCLREDRDVTGRDLQALAELAAELHAGAAARDAEYLMHGGVIMRIVVDAVAPSCPSRWLPNSCSMVASRVFADVDRALVDQERHRIVAAPVRRRLKMTACGSAPD